jgi:RNA polymerase sigma factor (TIGR02999 family)
MSDVTRILSAIEQGHPHAAEQLLPLVYDELRQLAATRLAQEAPNNTLDATALVHEAYVRLVGPADADRWENRGHFFAAAATAMRRILIERARRKRRRIHGGGRQRQELHPDLVAAPAPDDDLLALDAALARLAERDPVKARLVELRYFAGLTGDQAAQILGIAPKNGGSLLGLCPRLAASRHGRRRGRTKKTRTALTPERAVRRIEYRRERPLTGGLP